jgi:hypothetical protein
LHASLSAVGLGLRHGHARQKWAKLSFATLFLSAAAAICARRIYSGLRTGVSEDRYGHLIHVDQAPVKFWLHTAGDLGATLIGVGFVTLFVVALVSIPADRRKTRRLTMQALTEPPRAMADARLPPRPRRSP